MDDTIRVFSGRTFSPEDIELIQWIRKTYPKLSKEELTATICEMLGWNTPAGRPKTMQCHKYLELLESKGMIQLPPVRPIKKSTECKKQTEYVFDYTEIKGEVADFEPIQIVIAKPGEDLKRWQRIHRSVSYVGI